MLNYRTPNMCETCMSSMTSIIPIFKLMRIKVDQTLQKSCFTKTIHVNFETLKRNLENSCFTLENSRGNSGTHANPQELMFILECT